MFPQHSEEEPSTTCTSVHVPFSLLPSPLLPSLPPSLSSDASQLNWVKWRHGVILQYGNLTLMTIEELRNGLFPRSQELQTIKILKDNKWDAHRYMYQQNLTHWSKVHGFMSEWMDAQLHMGWGVGGGYNVYVCPPLKCSPPPLVNLPSSNTVVG